MGFSEELLKRVASTPTPEIETYDDQGSHRVTIWAVVEGDEVFLRSWKGERGAWYQRALKNPEVTLHLGDLAVEARVAHTPDEESIERYSRVLMSQDRPKRWVDDMLLPDVLATTLRIDPR